MLILSRLILLDNDEASEAATPAVGLWVPRLELTRARDKRLLHHGFGRDLNR